MLSVQKVMGKVAERYSGKLSGDGRVPGQRINLLAAAVVDEVNSELAEVWTAITDIRGRLPGVISTQPLTNETEAELKD